MSDRALSKGPSGPYPAKRCDYPLCVPPLGAIRRPPRRSSGLKNRLDRLITIGERTNELLEHELLRVPDHTGQRQQRKSASTERVPRRALTRSPSLKEAQQQHSDGLTAATRGRTAQPARVEVPRKLHEAIIDVLLDAGEPLTANKIAGHIRERNLFIPPRSGHELRGGQVSARVGNATYRDRFVRREGPDMARRPRGRAPSRHGAVTTSDEIRRADFEYLTGRPSSSLVGLARRPPPQSRRARVRAANSSTQMARTALRSVCPSELSACESPCESPQLRLELCRAAQTRTNGRS